MSEHVCPWWIGYLLANPIRRLWQDPAQVLAPYIREGMLILEPGPGMGFFTLELARRAGTSGRVIALDVQPRMLEALKRRAVKAGLQERIETRLVPSDTLALTDLTGRVDFVLAFAMVHELPSPTGFFAEITQAMRPGATLLLAEPSGHVRKATFEEELQYAALAGLTVSQRPSIRRSHAALLTKS